MANLAIVQPPSRTLAYPEWSERFLPTVAVRPSAKNIAKLEEAANKLCDALNAFNELHGLDENWRDGVEEATLALARDVAQETSYAAAVARMANSGINQYQSTLALIKGERQRRRLTGEIRYELARAEAEERRAIRGEQSLTFNLAQETSAAVRPELVARFEKLVATERTFCARADAQDLAQALTFLPTLPEKFIHARKIPLVGGFLERGLDRFKSFVDGVSEQPLSETTAVELDQALAALRTRGIKGKDALDKSADVTSHWGQVLLDKAYRDLEADLAQIEGWLNVASGLQTIHNRLAPVPDLTAPAAISAISQEGPGFSGIG